MRIFKHIGDIYFSSVRPIINLEQKILVILLSVLVVVTILFVILLGIKYDFSVKAFLAPNSGVEIKEEEAVKLPEVSGKTNYVYILMSGDESTICFCSLIQVDLDNLIYKVCTFSPKTVYENTTLQRQYKKGGGMRVKASLEKLLGIDIDFYIEQTIIQYKNMYNTMGSVVYTVENDISYKDNSQYGFNLKIKDGEQKIDGDNMSKLLRYYAEEEKNYTKVSEILLFSLSQQINEENYNKRESLFPTFISLTQTNITIKDFTSSIDELKVIANENVGMTISNISTEYNSNNLTKDNKKTIKENFTK